MPTIFSRHARSAQIINRARLAVGFKFNFTTPAQPDLAGFYGAAGNRLANRSQFRLYPPRSTTTRKLLAGDALVKS